MTQKLCESCKGFGSAWTITLHDNRKPAIKNLCDLCKGSGYLKVWFFWKKCKKCKGVGYTFEWEPAERFSYKVGCLVCRGEGIEEERE